MFIYSSKVAAKLRLARLVGLVPSALNSRIVKRYRAGSREDASSRPLQWRVHDVIRCGSPPAPDGAARMMGVVRHKASSSPGALLSELHVILDGRDAADATRIHQRLLYVGF